MLWRLHSLEGFRRAFPEAPPVGDREPAHVALVSHARCQLPAKGQLDQEVAARRPGSKSDRQAAVRPRSLSRLSGLMAVRKAGGGYEAEQAYRRRFFTPPPVVFQPSAPLQADSALGQLGEVVGGAGQRPLRIPAKADRDSDRSRTVVRSIAGQLSDDAGQCLPSTVMGSC